MTEKNQELNRLFDFCADDKNLEKLGNLAREDKATLLKCLKRAESIETNEDANNFENEFFEIIESVIDVPVHSRGASYRGTTIHVRGSSLNASSTGRLPTNTAVNLKKILSDLASKAAEEPEDNTLSELDNSLEE